MSGSAGPSRDTGSRPVRPPRVAESLLARVLPSGERDEIVGDMAERYARRAGAGRGAARLWYWRNALSTALRMGWRNVRAGFSGQELRHAARGLRGSPYFTTVAVLSLGLGIGANAAIFSVVRSVMFTELAVERPEELRLVYYERPRVVDVSNYSSSSDEHPVTGATINSNYSFPISERMRQAVGDRAELLGFNFTWPAVAVSVNGQPAISAAGMLTSGDFFATLRPQVAMGRPYDPNDDRADVPRVVVITHSFWQRAFGGDPGVIGRIAMINGTPFEVVGVTAAGFDGLSPGGFFPPTEVFAPFATQEAFAPRWTPAQGSLAASDHVYWVRMMARVPAGVEDAPLEEAMTAALRETLLATGVLDDPETVDEAHVRFIDGSRGRDSLRREMQRPLALLGGVVAAVLLIACVNLAGLMLARGSARQHEIAVRRALGAGRLRLVRQLLIESLLLAGAGGALGLLLAMWGGPTVTAALTASLGRVAVRFRLDWQLLGIVALVSIVAALLCGILPALRLTRSAVHDPLRTRAFGDGKRAVLGRALIAAQIAVSIPLIVGAGLFLRTVGNLGDVELGFNPDNLVIFRIDPSNVAGDRQQIDTILRDILQGLEELPRVAGATLVENSLLSGWLSNTRVEIDGELAGMYMNAVGPRYFEIMEIPLLAGRALRPTDDARALRVVVVNETAQRELFGGNALGRSFTQDEERYEIVGVVADFKYDSLQGEIEPTFYDPAAQRGLSTAHIVVRTPVPPDQLESPIREIVARAAPFMPVDSIFSQSEQIARATGRERVFARILVLFGGFALLVASIGLYGVTSFAVSRRRPELGVRLALGARPRQILWLVLRSVLVVALFGLAVGLLAARAVGPVIGSMLYGLEPGDAATMAGAALVMLLVALAAGWIPALRAARTDALIVLSRD